MVEPEPSVPSPLEMQLPVSRRAQLESFLANIPPQDRYDVGLAFDRYSRASQVEADSMLVRGEALASLKDRLPHGRWLPCLEALGIDARTAQYYVQGYEACRDDPANAQRVARLGLTFRAWIALTATSTPPDVRERVLAGEIAATEVAIRTAIPGHSDEAVAKSGPANRVLSLLWRIRDERVHVDDVVDALEHLPDERMGEALRLADAWSRLLYAAVQECGA